MAVVIPGRRSAGRERERDRTRERERERDRARESSGVWQAAVDGPCTIAAMLWAGPGSAGRLSESQRTSESLRRIGPRPRELVTRTRGAARLPPGPDAQHRTPRSCPRSRPRRRHGGSRDSDARHILDPTSHWRAAGEAGRYRLPSHGHHIRVSPGTRIARDAQIAVGRLLGCTRKSPTRRNPGRQRKGTGSTRIPGRLTRTAWPGHCESDSDARQVGRLGRRAGSLADSPLLRELVGVELRHGVDRHALADLRPARATSPSARMRASAG